ncbi:MAG: histidine phosphatase family protein [Acidiferrobacterales bacterium]
MKDTARIGVYPDKSMVTRQTLHALGWLALVAFFSPWGAAPAEGVDALSGEALVRALQGGGYNVYFRHAATDWSQTDHVRAAGDWTSCDPSQIRQLSEEGRRTAREVGEAIRALGIPVGQVMASPYCRTVETAQLMALGPVDTTTDVINLRVAEYFDGRKAIAQRARARLGVPPAPGTNTVLVAHGNVAREATNVYPAEGEGIVFHPDGNGDFVFIGRLTPKEWARLAQMIVIK